MKALARLTLFLIVLGFWVGVFQFNTETRQLTYHPKAINTFTSKMEKSIKDLTGFNTSIIQEEVKKVAQTLKQ